MTREADRPSALRAWFDRVSAELAAALADGGAALRSTACEVRDEAAVREALPPACASFVIPLTRGEVSAKMIFLLPPAASRRLIWAQADDGADKCGSEDALSDEETDLLDGRAEAFGKALGSLLGSSLQDAELGEITANHLKDAAWSSEDPLTEGAHLSLDFEVDALGGTAAGQLLAPVMVFEEIAPDMLDAPPEAEPPPPGTIPDGLVSMTMTPAVAQRIEEGLGAVNDCGGLDLLVAAWSRPDVGGAVVEIPAGGEYMLTALRGLLDFPGCAERPLVILLEQPTTWNVIRCGRLGLFDVLPANCSGSDIARKVAGL